MKITPLEIRQKTFEKAFRGYDKDEVNAYLQSLSQEWERILDETKELRIKLENAEKEIEKLREVENSLFKTLKTAEDTGASMIDQANKAAELHLKETQMRAEALMSEAKTKAKATLEEAEMKARTAMEEVEEELKVMSQVFKSLQNTRDDFAGDLKNLANDILEKVQRSVPKDMEFDAEEHLRKVRDFKIDVTLTSRSVEKPAADTQKTTEPDQSSQEEPKPTSPDETIPEVAGEDGKKQQKEKGGGSFFDEIG